MSAKVRTGLSWTGVAALFLVLRLFAITHYDWRASFAVVDTIDVNDAIAVMMGTFMADRVVSGVALAVLLPVLLIHEGRRRRRGKPIAGSIAGLVAVVVFAIAYVWTFRGWWLPIAAVALTGLLVFLLRRRGARAGREAATWLVGRVGLVVAAVVLVVAATVSTPWVPLERISTTDGTVTGYVMDTPPGYLNVLRAKDRQTVYVETATVTKRVELDE